MADRFFPNVMPDFVPESATEIQEEAEPALPASQDSLMKLLSMPYPSLSERFKRAALDLKETVSNSFCFLICFRVCVFRGVYSMPYQVNVVLLQIVVQTWGMSGQRVQDSTLYSGSLGAAFLLFKAYLFTKNKNDLALCSQIVKACHSASFNSRYTLSLILFFLCLMSLDEA